MDPLHSVLLVILGVGAGTLASLLGGASLITFPALLAMGMSPITAAIVNNVALTPGNLTAVYYERSRLPPFDRSLVALLLVALLGAIAGAFLLLATPVKVFTALVPLLLALATLLFACSAQVGRWIEHRASRKSGPPASRWGATIAAMIPVSIYSTYFGAGVGVLLIAILSVGAGGDYRTANAVKNLITGMSCLVAGIIFALRGALVWQPMLLLMVGAIAGAWFGTRIARIAPRRTMRLVVILLSITLTLVYAWRFWL